MTALTLRLRHETCDGTAVVTVSGEVTIYNAPRLRQVLRSLAEDGMDPVTAVVDLGAVAFLDSTGLGVLVGAWRRLKANGGTLIIACPESNEPVLRLLRITALTRVFRVSESVEAALREKRTGEEGSHVPGRS